MTYTALSFQRVTLESSEKRMDPSIKYWDDRKKDYLDDIAGPFG
ncbi:hypothetical protein [Wolbachia endosymbiont of Ctenocephalides felis wCfeJ]|nr:hypothetical protein [Wolbachia endosymbiont of Ctenocephalides felis wCfeJ]